MWVQFFCSMWALSSELNISGQPDRQHDLETFRTGQVRRKPDFFQRVDDRLVLIDRRFSSSFWLWFGKALESLENPDGMFSVTSAGGAEFIQDGGFFMTGGIFIS